MTTKEIAELAGVSTDTVSRTAKTLYPDKFSQGKRVVYQKIEATRLMSELRKKGFIELPQNAEELPQNAEELPQNAEGLDIAFKMAIVALTSMAQGMDARLSKIEFRIEQRKALLPPPAIKPRDHISMIIREYASKTGEDYAGAWGELYRQFGYRTNSNPSISAKNRGMKIIDYIDTEGQIETLEAVAMEIFKR